MIELPRVSNENEHNFGYRSLFLAFNQSNRSLKRGARHVTRALSKFRPKKGILMGVLDTFYVFSVFYAFCFWAYVWLMAFL
ncbi:hypothetical protein HanPSC8_Chr09g0392371 [Helianthus annuus]|nr:hypothetical protein HanPSC8_Chr09g0392371 [Helianthus annuus]